MRYGPVFVSWKPWRPHQSHAFRHASSRCRPGKNRTSRFSNMERTKAGCVLGFSHPRDESPQHSYEPTKSPRAAACVGCQAWSKAQGSGSCPVGVRRFKSCPTHPPDSGSSDPSTTDTSGHWRRIDGAPETTRCGFRWRSLYRVHMNFINAHEVRRPTAIRHPV